MWKVEILTIFVPPSVIKPVEARVERDAKHVGLTVAKNEALLGLLSRAVAMRHKAFHL